MSVNQLLLTIRPEILSRVNTLDLNIPSSRCNDAVNSLLQRTVLLGGKRLRPLLTYLMGDLFSLPLNRIDLAARSIEQVHAASLSHDDVVDGATTRRGRPSINQLAGNQKAVLAGDYLLADLIIQLTEEGNLQLVTEMASIIQALALGEWLQLDIANDRTVDQEKIEQVARYKTASVMSWCCVAPAYLAGLEDSLISLCREFGECLGMAFQLMDDTIDFQHDSLKDINLDIDNGVLNMVIFHWLEANPDAKERFRQGEELVSLITPINLGEAVEAVKQQAGGYLERGQKLLHQIGALYVQQDQNKKHPQFANKMVPLFTIIDYLGGRES
ncbi:MAG: polyprenyl synthetase family protein [Bdellovibrionales bacterium]|nr:polyprenyl synthetase family protein [Bdellovibrionales bacterium]MBT3525410.1 polyprenyl synthetase family protein [Bdellovibrionales bacterium]MBT7766267.1 polyprenyl synthetase family protein [Bdellovibrionales bacterium]